ncbi:hypothetical protein KQX54_009951 [Cotesia glomerata]|uniref:Uncharacterized protein n=1 Tax=Cotesia glomerata TaxID=32391 RepID=A0AAV7J426_COTGL|nr:hypothetical protein KQX54_009951 [Cotesia glomerata]
MVKLMTPGPSGKNKSQWIVFELLQFIFSVMEKYKESKATSQEGNGAMDDGSTSNGHVSRIWTQGGVNG